MSYTVKISENETHVLKIIQDDDALNPRTEYDNLGTMVCWHRDYDLGDKHSYSEHRDFLENMVFDISNMEQDEIEEIDDEGLIGLLNEEMVMLPLYIYDHSGITMNTTGFTCRWDSGQVGWIYITNDEIVKEYGSLNIDEAKEMLIGEVKIYDQYLTGDVYGYILEEKTICERCENTDFNTVDSCWGFFGLKYLEEDLVGYIGDEHKELVENLK